MDSCNIKIVQFSIAIGLFSIAIGPISVEIVQFSTANSLFSVVIGEFSVEPDNLVLGLVHSVS